MSLDAIRESIVHALLLCVASMLLLNDTDLATHLVLWAQLP